MGRNTWNLWSGGNEHFWDHAAQDNFALTDLLKMLDNRKFARGVPRPGERAWIPGSQQARRIRFVAR